MKWYLNIKRINYAILLIKFIILILFVFASIRGFQETILELNVTYGDQYKLSDVIQLIKTRAYFRSSFLLLIPLIGIFINKRNGWIFIASYFYFLMTQLVFSTILNGRHYDEEIIFFLGVLLFISLCVWIMNRKKIFEQVYGIKKNEILITNIKAFSLGIFLTLYIAWTKVI